MTPKQIELAYAGVIVLVLLGLAGFYGWRQWQALRRLRTQAELDREDRRYHHRQAWRRLICCSLMAVLAGMIVSFYVLGLNDRAAELRPGPEGDPVAQQIAEDARQDFVNFLSIYWMSATFLIVAILFLALFDLMAIRQYGLRHLRRLQSDHRAVLEQQVASLRSQRNGD